MTIEEFLREHNNIAISVQDEIVYCKTTFETRCWGDWDVLNAYATHESIDKILSQFSSYVYEKKQDAYWNS